MLYSLQGSQQGDPLGPAFFSLSIQHAISFVQNSEGVEWQVWCLNDGVLVGDPCALLRVLDTLTAQFCQLGLWVNLSKCKLWSPRRLTGTPRSKSWAPPSARKKLSLKFFRRLAPSTTSYSNDFPGYPTPR